MTDTCSNCRFGYASEPNHFCRHDPPEFVSPDTSVLKPTWPDGWCGRHEKAIVKRTEGRIVGDNLRKHRTSAKEWL